CVPQMTGFCFFDAGRGPAANERFRAWLYVGHPRLDTRSNKQVVDGRNKSGHDVARLCASLVMPALVAGIHVLTLIVTTKTCMAGTSPAMTLRGCAPHLSCPRLSRASTSLQLCNAKDVDGRNESGHDVARLCLCLARLYAERDVFVALHVKA